MAPKDAALIFAQSQSEDFGEFEGSVDTTMAYHEFVEALLRLALPIAGDASEKPDGAGYAPGHAPKLPELKRAQTTGLAATAAAMRLD